jgi:hypothetical protein
MAETSRCANWLCLSSFFEVKNIHSDDADKLESRRRVRCLLIAGKVWLLGGIVLVRVGDASGRQVHALHTAEGHLISAQLLYRPQGAVVAGLGADSATRLSAKEGGMQDVLEGHAALLLHHAPLNVRMQLVWVVGNK